MKRNGTFRHVYQLSVFSIFLNQAPYKGHFLSLSSRFLALLNPKRVYNNKDLSDKKFSRANMVVYKILS